MINRFLLRLSGFLTAALPLCAELTYRGALDPPEGYEWGGWIHGSGNTLLVRIGVAGNLSLAPTFAVYLKDGVGQWSVVSIITADPDLEEAIGWSGGFAVSEDIIVLIGEVFLREGDTWIGRDILVPPQLGEEEFGNTVSIDGDVILVDGRHVFRRAGDRWIYEEEREVTAPPASLFVRGINEGAGETQKITANAMSSGEVRLFKEVGSEWQEIALLTPPDPVFEITVTNRSGNTSSWHPVQAGGGQFGSSIALTEDAVFVFEGGHSLTPVVPTVHLFEGDGPEARWKTFLEGGEWVYDTMLGTYFERHHPWVYKEGTGWIYKGGDGYLYLHDQGSWSWAAGEGWIVDLPTGEWQYLPMD